jgi:hypothetical protein
MKTTSELRLPSLNKLYLKRRSQRNNALKKVIKQWHQLEHTEQFLGTLQAWNSGTDGYFALDDFLDHVADVVQEDASSLDGAVDRLVAANKRFNDVIDAMDQNLYSYEIPKGVVKAPGGNYDSEQVRNIVLKVLVNPNLGRQAVRGVFDQVGDGMKSVSSLNPENLDKVYEACRSLLAGKGRSADVEQKPHVERSVGKVVHLNDARRARRGRKLRIPREQ